jgi:dihydropteroate synthase
MGILNVTPDSFSDGGRYVDPTAAIEAAERMVGEGANLIDIGGESTRPGSDPVSLDEELRRLMPVVESLAGNGFDMSVDTMKPEVARQALAAGATVINDVTGLRDPEMRRVCADAGCNVCIMHMQGEPKTMQVAPHYEDVVAEVRDYLRKAAETAEASGIQRNRIWIDPGIGFGKTLSHNLLLLKHLNVLVELGYPVLVGVSRKRFIGQFGRGTDLVPIEERLPGTLAAQVLAQSAGVSIIRAHDVRESRLAIDVAAAILNDVSPHWR